MVALLTVAAIVGGGHHLRRDGQRHGQQHRVGIAVLWVVLYGGGFLLSFLPLRYPSPDRALQRLPHILQGNYDLNSLAQFVGWSLVACCVTALVGLAYFSRRDV